MKGETSEDNFTLIVHCQIDASERENDVTNATRRSFIGQASVVAGALAVGPLLGRLGARPELPSPPVTAPTLAEPIAAYVRDSGAGEITLLVGTREVVVRDFDLVARLVRAAG